MLRFLFLLLLWITCAHCRVRPICFEAQDERSIIPTAADCRFILAHLPFNHYDSFPRTTNVKLNPSSPFFPILRIRHGTCQFVFQAAVYAPKGQEPSPADWRGSWVPRFWPELKQAAEDVVAACGPENQSGKVLLLYGLERDTILKLTVTNSDHLLIRQSYDARITRQRQSLREVDDTFDPVSIWAEASYEV